VYFCDDTYISNGLRITVVLHFYTPGSYKISILKYLKLFANDVIPIGKLVFYFSKSKAETIVGHLKSNFLSKIVKKNV